MVLPLGARAQDMTLAGGAKGWGTNWRVGVDGVMGGRSSGSTSVGKVRAPDFLPAIVFLRHAREGVRTPAPLLAAELLSLRARWLPPSALRSPPYIPPLCPTYAAETTRRVAAIAAKMAARMPRPPPPAAQDGVMTWSGDLNTNGGGFSGISQSMAAVDLSAYAGLEVTYEALGSDATPVAL